MHIVRWLMSHPIISAWLLAGLAILLNFDSGSHKGDEHKAAASDAHVEQNHEQAAHGVEAPATTTEASAEHAVAVPASTTEATPSVASAAAPATAATESAATAPTQDSTPAMAGHATAAAPVVTESAPASAEAKAPAMSNQSAAIAPATAVVASGAMAAASTAAAGKETVESQVSSTTAPQQAPAAAADKDLSSKAPNELLQMARQAYQDKNLNSSVAAYQALLKLEPNKIEYKGELGNVYYHQNKQKEAANMYAEIALPLIDQGKSEQVANMLGFIGAFYPQKAAEINKYMQAHK